MKKKTVAIAGRHLLRACAAGIRYAKDVTRRLLRRCTIVSHYLAVARFLMCEIWLRCVRAVMRRLTF